MTAPETLVDVLKDRAGSRQGLKGFTFLVDGDGLEQHLDYVELERRAKRLGEVLSARVQRGDRALLVFEAGLDFVVALFGCLYAGVVAVPVYPPSPLRPEPGLAHIDRAARDAQARVALSSAGLIVRLRPLLIGASSAGTLDWIDVAHAHGDRGPRLPEIGEEDAAILQYTSGSTSDPKGVVLTHRNLIHNARFIREAFALSENSCGVSWLPPHHDMGLMGGIIEPLFLGVDAVLFAPQLFVQRPLIFLQTITRFRGTTCGAPSFAYDLLTRRVPESAKPQLDLSSWSVAFCGAEPVRASALDAFAEAFSVCGFRRQAFLSCYGLAEATLLVSASTPDKEPRRLTVDAAALEEGRVIRAEPTARSTRTLVSCGRPPAGIRVVIAEPASGRVQPEGRTGEIWVKGPNVSSGYWADAKATAGTFEARPESGEAGYLRTGDLGFIDQSELFVAGRLKDLIIIRGRNLYPQDIESTVEHAHSAVRPGRSAAFSAEIEDEERLVIACEVTRKDRVDEGSIKDAIQRAVASAHGVTPYGLALLDSACLPRTSSGKPRRSMCRQQFLAGRLGVLGEAVE